METHGACGLLQLKRPISLDILDTYREYRTYTPILLGCQPRLLYTSTRILDILDTCILYSSSTSSTSLHREWLTQVGPDLDGSRIRILVGAGGV